MTTAPSSGLANRFTQILAGEDHLDGGALMAALIQDASAAHASDIHIDPLKRVYRVRFRIDGSLHEAARIPTEAGEHMVRAFQVSAEIDSNTGGQTLDGRASSPALSSEVRIATAPGVLGDKITVRLLQEKNLIFDLQRLGMEPELEEEVRRIVDTHQGMILVSGSSGSGKTTTAYALLNELLTSDEVNLMTLEDPVEYVLEAATQIEVDEDRGLGYHEGIRALLRHDPDCLFLGEIRDSETAANAVDACFSGHTVLSTVHARRAVSTATMLRSMGVPRHMLAPALRLVINQRLIRRLCSHCQDTRSLTTSEEAWMRSVGLEPAKKTPVARGCDECADTGYRGRRAVFEAWEIDEEAYRHILDGSDDHQMATSFEGKGKTLLHHGRHLMESGEIGLAELRCLI